MRIVVIETAPYGGLLHYSVQLGNALAERGHVVDLLTARDNEMIDYAGAARMRAVLTPPVRSAAPPPPGYVAMQVKRAGVAVRMTRAWVRVLWEVARGGYDVVLLDASFDVSVAAAGAVALTAIPGGPPIAQICHNARIFNRWRGGQKYGGSPVLMTLLPAAFRRFDLIFMHGERSRDEFSSQWVSRRVDLIPHGDERMFGSEPPRRARDERVLFFGHWNRVKGLPVLMAAFEELTERLPTATLTIAGAANPQEVDVPEIKRWAKDQGGRVDVIDRYVPVDEVRALFAEARVVVIPYVAGYQSGIVHLAMTMARPVVASDVGDLRLAVIDGETGLLVPPGDSTALAAALERVLRDPDMATEMGASGRQLVMTQSGWETVAEKVETSLDELVSEGRASQLDR